MIPFKELVTERMVLRAPKASDAGPMHLFASDLRVAAMTTSIPHPYPPGAAQSYLDGVVSRLDKEVLWSIDASPSGGAEFVGLIVARHVDSEIGYWVGPPFWRTGYATEAAAEVTRYLIDECGHAVVTATVFVENLASQAVMRKAGFRQDGDLLQFSVARATEVRSLRFVHDAG